MNKQYQVVVKNSADNSFIANILANDWCDIPSVVKNVYGSDCYVFEYSNTPVDFCERYPDLINDRIRRQEEAKKRLRELF